MDELEKPFVDLVEAHFPKEFILGGPVRMHSPGEESTDASIVFQMFVDDACNVHDCASSLGGTVTGDGRHLTIETTLDRRQYQLVVDLRDSSEKIETQFEAWLSHEFPELRIVDGPSCQGAVVKVTVVIEDARDVSGIARRMEAATGNVAGKPVIKGAFLGFLEATDEVEFVVFTMESSEL